MKDSTVKRELINQVNSYFKEDKYKTICINIINYIDYKYTYMTYGRLHNVAGLKESSEDLIICIQYLEGIGLIKRNLEYVDDNDNCFSLEQYEDSSELYHPETGELITDMSRVGYYFSATELTKDN